MGLAILILAVTCLLTAIASVVGKLQPTIPILFLAVTVLIMAVSGYAGVR